MKTRIKWAFRIDSKLRREIRIAIIELLRKKLIFLYKPNSYIKTIL